MKMKKVIVQITYLDYTSEYGRCEAVIRIPVVSKDPVCAAARIARVKHNIMPFDITDIMLCIPE
jgi:hypothetical protein